MIVYDISLSLLLTVCFLYPIRRYEQSRFLQYIAIINKHIYSARRETTYNFRLRKMAFRTVSTMSTSCVFLY